MRPYYYQHRVYTFRVGEREATVLAARGDAGRRHAEATVLRFLSQHGDPPPEFVREQEVGGIVEVSVGRGVHGLDAIYEVPVSWDKQERYSENNETHPTGRMIPWSELFLVVGPSGCPEYAINMLNRKLEAKFLANFAVRGNVQERKLDAVCFVSPEPL